ncbi:MAG: PaREP1 family protein [Acidianus infernus]|nr:PaREP1 family protein [Acidianus infernus]
MMLSLKTSADIYLEEADELLKKGDLIQASEKLYKAAEEAIRLLSFILKLNLEIVNTKSLTDAVFLISEKLNDSKIPIYWASAISLITVNLSKEVVKDLRNDVEELVKIADREYIKVLGRG